MKKLRIGLIGVGGIATQRHLPVLKQLHEIAGVEAVYDMNQAAAKHAAEAFQIQHRCEEVSEIWEHIDALYICTPNSSHKELAIQALENGKHVFCEKPMAMSAAECEEMTAASEKAGKILMIGYHYRFMEEVQTAKRMIENGEIGEPFVIRAQALRRRKVPGWGVFIQKHLQGGGCLIDYGCHFIDLAMYLLDFPGVSDVHGQAYTKVSRSPEQVNEWGAYNPDDMDVEDHVTAYIRFSDTTTMLFETSWAANIEDDKESLSISGTAGGIDLFPLRLNQTKYGAMLNQTAAWTGTGKEPGYYQASNFIQSCLGKETPVITPKQAWAVSEVIDAIYADTKE
ncbi:Gfo/Idh/MocA family protein [Alteribacillus sp. HJP-4]|uniref:Gfo/Idh/MocA family protein n=1 Tax=Alteribacillus sp. HJP-4 TaxID=2775394 RepID=UPI0035CD38C3